MLKPNFLTEKVEVLDGYGKFIISPLPAGFGQTLGHSIRRALLSSIEGASITHVKIDGVNHQFSTIEGLKESVLDMILNLKLLRFKTTATGPFTVSYTGKGIGKITGADFKGAAVSVANPDQYIAEITSAKTKLSIDLDIEKGIGYTTAEEKEKKEFGVLSVDSIFSPVSKVNYQVEGVRVGRTSDFDKLTLEIWTDATIDPLKALEIAASTLSSFFGYILSDAQVAEDALNNAAAQIKISKEIDKKVYELYGLGDEEIKIIEKT